MRRIKLSFSLLLCLFLALVFVPGAVFADTENFYFESFDADYYLSRDEEGISHLRVVENFTTVFPDYKQNKGICRYIPFTNQDNANVVLPWLSGSNITIKRNGEAEPIYSIQKVGSSYEVCTGDDDYVIGKQVYTFEYEFEKVITDFDDYQELYWDTNGNGWAQKFGSVVARVHFIGDEIAKNYTGDSWCYVGRYGENGSNRCTISPMNDGLEFAAMNLAGYENLTFDIEFQPGVFVVPEPEENYTLVVVMGVTLLVCILCLVRPMKKFLATREKARYYKGIFVKPEYQPDSKYNVAEMTENYIGEKKDSKVSVMLDMIVKGKIKLIKETTDILKRDKWWIEVENLEGVYGEGVILLRILNGGTMPKVGDKIEIVKHTANNALVALGQKYDKTVIADLKRDGLYEANYSGNSTGFAVILIIVAFMLAPVVAGVIESLEEDGVSFALTGKVIGAEVFLQVMAVILISGIAIFIILKRQTSNYIYRTKKGLEASRYMNGLKMYIEMAEKDRLAFLQSVKGTDVSVEGIVHLYEKLLPYAAALGLEKSWVKELEKYYQLEEVETPSWYYHDMTMLGVLSAVRSASSAVSYATTYVSSGGGSSSGFSGSGGGGFSGGGGGGGGGHGR